MSTGDILLRYIGLHSHCEEVDQLHLYFRQSQSIDYNSVEYLFQDLDHQQLLSVFLEMAYLRQMKHLLYCPLRYFETTAYLQ